MFERDYKIYKAGMEAQKSLTRYVFEAVLESVEDDYKFSKEQLVKILKEILYDR